MFLKGLRNKFLPWRGGRPEGYFARRNIDRTSHRLLVIKLSSLGDVAQVLPALSDLKERNPELSLTFMTSESLAPLAHQYFQNRKKGIKVLPFLGYRKIVRKKWSGSFDVVLDFQGLLRTHLLALCIRKELLFTRNRFLLSDHIYHERRKRHAPSTYHLELRYHGYRIAKKKTSVRPFDKTVFLCPESRWRTKDWRVHDFVKLTKAFLGLGWNPVLLGVKKDGKFPQECKDLRGETSLRYH